MDREAREIPGYYYDKEKRKYFKIQASSTAPASSAYSSKDVKRRKLQDERSEAVTLRIARQRGRIQKSRILCEPIAGGFLAREQGQAGLDVSRIYAGGLVQQGYLPAMTNFDHCSDPIFTIDHRFDLGPSLVDFRIVFDDQLFTIRANVDKNNRTRSHGSVEICHDFSVPTINSASWKLERFGHPGTSTSLTTHEASRRLAMTWLAGSPHSGAAIVPMTGIPTDGDREEPNILLGPGVSRGMDVSFYSSAAAPPESSLLFAFGSSHGIMTVDKRDFDAHFISPKPVPQERYPKDIFALEFLSDNHPVLLSGGRNGILDITDLRIPKFGHDADIIRHPSSITHIKQLDTHRIIVAGLNSSLCQYDLRYRKIDAPPPSPPSRRKLKSISNTKATKPILQYPGFHNTASIQLGFDVDLETGVVAAAQEHDATHPAVQLFSLHGGDELPPSQVSKFSSLDDDENIKCLRFARDIEDKMKSLYFVSGGIQRYAWACEEETHCY